MSRFRSQSATLPAILFLYSLSSGDLNGDGIPDLAVTAPIDGSAVSYALGAGDGMLKTWNYATAASLPAFVLLADVNGDGNLDALTTDGNFGFVEIDFGDGHGNFPSSTSTNTVYFDGPLAVADLNKDGIADIVGIYYSGGPATQAGSQLCSEQGTAALVRRGTSRVVGSIRLHSLLPI